ncbi:hypothetical protein BJ138DRAFT_1000538 [Hygrophoropsis aurantiaca]|uniref:Uncharacterized protein n=1 Tax=Hygrophoropsis aurantiaca TaxID=72124 RepID=A0ACB8ANZ7_9AGAM|nr:hypothetical protein BJ138DRAFT_1000538 [Hygrophoropsis aurantiaca]
MNTSLLSLNRTIDNYNQQIEVETRKMESDTQAKREETNRRLEALKEAVRKAEETQANILQQKREKVNQQDEIKKQGEAAEKTRNELQARISECQTMITRCKEQEKNILAPYGRDIKGVREQISKMNWHGEVPMGPLGAFVKLKDSFWAPLLRTQLGGMMTAFACTDARDRQQLKALFHRTGNDHITIVISSRDMFDYASGEPHAQVTTVLRVSDAYVLRILINQLGIERTVIARTRIEGEETLKSVGGNGIAWTADWMRVNTYSDGGGQSTKIAPVGRGDPKNMLFTSAVGGTELGQVESLYVKWQENLTQAEGEYKTANAEYNRLRQEFSNISRDVNGFGGQERSAVEGLRIARVQYKTLQDEANEEMPTSITGLEAAKEDAETEKKSIMDQFTDLMGQKAEVNNEQKTLLTEINKIRDQIKNFEDSRSAIAVRFKILPTCTHNLTVIMSMQAKVDDAVKLRLDAQNNESHYTTKYKEEEATFKAAEAVADQLQTEFTVRLVGTSSV